MEQWNYKIQKIDTIFKVNEHRIKLYNGEKI